MKYGNLLLSIVISLMLVACNQTLTDRALEFTSNYLTGKSMQAEDWITEEGRKSEFFTRFGGLDALTRNATAEANAEGGIESIKVIRTQKQDSNVLVEVETTFKSKKKIISAEAWKKENGIWKVTPKTKESNNKEPLKPT